MIGWYFELYNISSRLMQDSYKVTKLLLACSVRTLADLSPVSKDSNVIINYLSPGICKSDILRDPMGGFEALSWTLVMAFLARSTEAGSRTLVFAVKPDAELETHGAFLVDCEVAT
jgi:hypothetical protein